MKRVVADLARSPNTAHVDGEGRTRLKPAKRTTRLGPKKSRKTTGEKKEK